MNQSKRKNRTGLKVLSPNWSLPIPSASSPVSVLAVQQSAPNTLTWSFSSPVSVTGSNVPQFQCSGDGVTFVSPTSVTVGGGDGTTVTAVYPSSLSLRGAAASTQSPVIPGGIFRVVTLPTNVSFTDGALSLPQSGQVILPSLAAKKRIASKKSAKKAGARARKLGKIAAAAKQVRRAA